MGRNHQGAEDADEEIRYLTRWLAGDEDANQWLREQLEEFY